VHTGVGGWVSRRYQPTPLICTPYEATGGSASLGPTLAVRAWLLLRQSTTVDRPAWDTFLASLPTLAACGGSPRGRRETVIVISVKQWRSSPSFNSSACMVLLAARAVSGHPRHNSLPTSRLTPLVSMPRCRTGARNCLRGGLWLIPHRLGGVVCCVRGMRVCACACVVLRPRARGPLFLPAGCILGLPRWSGCLSRAISALLLTYLLTRPPPCHGTCPLARLEPTWHLHAKAVRYIVLHGKMAFPGTRTRSDTIRSEVMHLRQNP
jgi:hypothetical protein